MKKQDGENPNLKKIKVKDSSKVPTSKVPTSKQVTSPKPVTPTVQRRSQSTTNLNSPQIELIQNENNLLNTQSTFFKTFGEMAKM